MKQTTLDSFFSARTSKKRSQEGLEEPVSKRQKTSTPTESPTKPSKEFEESLLGFLTQESWKAVLQNEFTKSYWRDLMKFLEKEHDAGAEIYPQI